MLFGPVCGHFLCYKAQDVRIRDENPGYLSTLMILARENFIGDHWCLLFGAEALAAFSMKIHGHDVNFISPILNHIYYELLTSRCSSW